MAVLLTLRVPNPQDILDQFGAGALIRIERDTVTTFATASEITTKAIVAQTSEYEHRDTTGVAGTHYYRTRYSVASPSVAADYSGYSATITPGAGDQWITLESAKGFSGLDDTVDDEWLAPQVDAVNAELTRRCGVFLGPSPDSTRTFDGDGTGILWVPGGIRALSTVEVRDDTSSSWETVTSTDVVLRPRAWEMPFGRAYPRLQFISSPTGTRSSFPAGTETVRITGTAFACFGWDSPPADVVNLGHVIIQRMTLQRAQGGDTRSLSYYIFPDDAKLLDGYRRLYFPKVI